MSDKANAEDSKLDGIKWALVAVLVVGAVYGNSYYAAESVLTRTIAILVLALVAGFIAAKTSKGRTFITLGMEAKTEIRKVVWPSRQETMHTTLIVVVVVLIVALILWGLDSLLSWIIALLIGG
jgi:preprotein translocase subunit SecE